jgi:hypothetical protein
MERRANESHKQHRHVSWNDAWLAEKQREQSRLTACRDIPTAGPVKLFVANVAREIPRIKARTLQYFNWRSPKHRPNSGMHVQASVSGDDRENDYVLGSEEVVETGGTSLNGPPRTGDPNDMPQLEEFTEERSEQNSTKEATHEKGNF